MPPPDLSPTAELARTWQLQKSLTADERRWAQMWRKGEAPKTEVATDPRPVLDGLKFSARFHLRSSASIGG
jgi:hypothetical protein